MNNPSPNFKIAAAIILLSALVPVMNQNLIAAESAEILDTLEVIGDAQYETGDVLAEENSLSRSTISQETLSRSQSALAEVIARESGIQYKQSGGFGSFSSVSIRAGSAAQTGVYLDGVLLNSGGNPVIDLATLEVLNLGSVDIYRGGSPSQLGHGGMGGAINLITQTGNAEPESRVRLETGSFGLRGLQLSHQTKRNKWDLLASLSHRQSDNDFTYLNQNGTPLNPNDDARERRENTHARRSSGLLRAGYQHRSDSRTDLTFQTSTRLLGVPEWRNQPDNQSSYETTTNQLQLAHIIDNINGWNSRQSAYWHTDGNHYQDPLAQIGLGAQDIENELDTRGLKSLWEYPTDNGTLGLSLDYRKESIDSMDRRDVFSNFHAQRDNWQANAYYTWFNESETLIITPSLRWQVSDFEASRLTPDGLSYDTTSSNKPGAQLGIRYEPGGKYRFSANVGNYFRTPSFGELYGSIGLVTGNPDLEAEEGINADLGVAYDHNNFELTATGFFKSNDQLIVTTYDSRGVGRPVNSGNALVYGLELGLRWQWSDEISLRSNFTWQNPKSNDPTTTFFDRFLPGEAQLSWFSRAEYATNSWSIWYELDIQQDRFYDRANILPAADSEQHSIGIGGDLKAWQYSISANNLGNANVEDFNGFPKPGRSFSLTLTRTL